jgi:tRNA G18 (ribose-2'-O)-methylase SpoU
VHWTGPDEVEWLAGQKQQDGTRIVSVELADEAVRLGDLPAARCRTIVVLGHERDGIPPEVMELSDTVVEIPMIGWGASLNVAVAGSLVLYRLAGFM